MSIIGIDTGGTFTDLVRLDPPERPGGARRVRVLKVPSTPADPAAALLAGLRAILGGEAASRVVHGTTVATNALIERKVARTALVTHRGMEDLVEIGRQARPDLYALEPRKPAPLVARELRFGLSDAETGRVPAPPPGAREPGAAERAMIEALRAAGVEAAAVCFLGSFREGRAREAEARVAARIAAALGIPAVASGALLPEIREVERFETAIANAALTPIMARYLGRVERESGRRVLVMRSDGGVAPAAAVAREPVRTLFSGPAGGLVGAGRAAARVGIGAFLSIDVGGTSTDVALSPAPGGMEEGRSLRSVGEVGGVRVAVPALDIVSVGAGGGSVAWRDAGGALRVGPRSAGANPGPACYGRGEEPTLTDAALVLGRLDARFFLGGAMGIFPERSALAIGRLARALGLSLERAAEGIMEVALAATERALRRVSIERGEDPRARALVAFGGAGGLLAAPLAARLGIARVIIPAQPGLLSALGMAEAPLVFTRSAGILAPLAAVGNGALDRALERIEAEALEAAAAEGVPGAGVRVVREVDLRYEGQSHALRVPYAPGRLAEDFHAAHERWNGFREEGRAIELVAVHVAAIFEEALPLSPTLPPEGGAGPNAQPIGASAAGPLYLRESLASGAAVDGPAVIGEYSGTTWVPAGWRARALATDDLLLEAGHG
jgi:N-methylhydantoinase A